METNNISNSHKIIILSLLIWIIGGILGYVLLGLGTSSVSFVKQYWIQQYSWDDIFSKATVFYLLYFSIPSFILAGVSWYVLNRNISNKNMFLLRLVAIGTAFVFTQASYYYFVRYMLSFERLLFAFGGILLAPVLGVFIQIPAYFLGDFIGKMYFRGVK